MAYCRELTGEIDVATGVLVTQSRAQPFLQIGCVESVRPESSEKHTQTIGILVDNVRVLRRRVCPQKRVKFVRARAVSSGGIFGCFVFTRYSYGLLSTE
ncbi:hypothetical protein C2U71_12055 [Burkholderia ubonensis]|nr:hypothetical protein C2U71_12055 [Burkholderia ubonensis]